MEPTWSAAETENNVIGFNLTEFNKCENKFQTNYRIFDLKICHEIFLLHRDIGQGSWKQDPKTSLG